MNATGTKNTYFGELPADNAEVIDGEDLVVDYGPFHRTSSGVAVTVQTHEGTDKYHDWFGGTDADALSDTNPKLGEVTYTIGPAGELAIVHVIHESMGTFDSLLVGASTLRVYAPGAWSQVTGNRYKDPHHETANPEKLKP